MITLQHGADVAQGTHDGEHSAIAMIETINRCERELRAAFPHALAVFRAGCEKLNPMSANA